MVIVCSSCDARLQLDDAKTPARAFAVRCPKCQASINVQPPPAEAEAPQMPTSSSGAATKVVATFERPAVAQLFRSNKEDAKSPGSNEADASMNDIARLLAEAWRRSSGEFRPDQAGHFVGRRKALVCASPAYRDAIAEPLAANNYKVFVAENMAEGLGRMREERMDVIILDANFDPVEQGVAFITREVKLMRPSERRRLFFVYVTSGVRTMDLQAAFLHNVNLVVNPSDIEQLPEALDVSIRHYNELYKPFNKALDAAPI